MSPDTDPAPLPFYDHFYGLSLILNHVQWTWSHKTASVRSFVALWWGVFKETSSDIREEVLNPQFIVVPAANMRELLIICWRLIDLWRGILSPAAGQRSKVRSRGSGSCYETIQLHGRSQIRISVCGYIVLHCMFSFCTLRIVCCQLLATVTCERPCVKVYSSHTKTEKHAAPFLQISGLENQLEIRRDAEPDKQITSPKWTEGNLNQMLVDPRKLTHFTSVTWRARWFVKQNHLRSQPCSIFATVDFMFVWLCPVGW